MCGASPQIETLAPLVCCWKRSPLLKPSPRVSSENCLIEDGLLACPEEVFDHVRSRNDLLGCRGRFGMMPLEKRNQEAEEAHDEADDNGNNG